MGNLIELECPCCHANLWIDPEKKEVVEHKKTKKKNFASFDDLVNKEKEKRAKVDERFIQAKDLGEAKKKKAEELFKKSFKE